jgi:uncharacterized membrane protein YoaK (UPF0700 family)
MSPSAQTTATARTPRASAHRWVALAAMLLAMALGAAYGYSFGAQVAGPVFGCVTGALGALFSSLLADAALERLFTRRAPPR